MTEVRQFDEHELSVDLVLLDEGYQAEIGDWLTPRDDFGSTVRLAADIRSSGRRAGIWVAPFLVGSQQRDRPAASRVAGRPASAPAPTGARSNWSSTSPTPAPRGISRTCSPSCAARATTTSSSTSCYAGAIEGPRHEQLDGIAAYRHGLRLLREAVGPNRILHGCGAPILPSLGLVDCMRISPDTDPLVDPPSGDISQPGQRGARSTSIAREFLHGRWWANDSGLPDRPARHPGPRSVGGPHRVCARPADVQRSDRRARPVGPRPHPGTADAELAPAPSVEGSRCLSPHPGRRRRQRPATADPGRLRHARPEHGRRPRLPARAGADRHRAQPVRLEVARAPRSSSGWPTTANCSATPTSGTRSWSPCTTC